MDQVQQQLLWLAAELARPDRGLVVHAEGSVAARGEGDRFWVKASGAALHGLHAAQTVECQASRILPILERPLLDPRDFDRALLDARLDPEAPRPSIETALHAWILQLEGVAFSAYLTPPHCLAVASSAAGEVYSEQRMFIEQVLHCGPRAIWVPYCDPGGALAREVRTRMSVYQRRSRESIPRLLVLQNRGIFVVAPTAESALSCALAAEHAARVFILAAQLSPGGPVFLKPHQVRRIEDPADQPRVRLLQR